METVFLPSLPKVWKCSLFFQGSAASPLPSLSYLTFLGSHCQFIVWAAVNQSIKTLLVSPSDLASTIPCKSSMITGVIFNACTKVIIISHLEFNRNSQ